MDTTIETAKKTFATALGAGTAVLDKARELPAKLQELPSKISELPQQIQALPARVSEYVTLPEAFKVSSIDLRDLPATLQAYAAKGTERALGLVGEGRETAKKATDFATEFLKGVSFGPLHIGSNGNGNGKAKKPAAKKPAAKKPVAKKATVATTTTTVE